MNNLKSILLLAVFGLTTAAVAQEQGHLNVKTVVQKEQVSISDEGERQVRLVEASAVTPGDSVVYTITFSNISDAPAENVVITNPVPENLTYIQGSAFGPGTNIEFSVDGGQNYAVADSLRVPDNGGTRDATAEDYTHLRWVMQSELPVGSQAVASFRAHLN
jgi:uncharacterized repeat protein (TIGR01451 family)